MLVFQISLGTVNTVTLPPQLQSVDFTSFHLGRKLATVWAENEVRQESAGGSRTAGKNTPGKSESRREQTLARAAGSLVADCPLTHTHILKQRGWFTMHVYMFVCVFVLSCMYRNCDARWDVWLNLGLGSSDDVVVEGGAHSCPVMSQHKWNNVTWRSVPVSSAPVLCLFQMCWGQVGPRTSTLNLLKEAHCALGIILITAKIIFQQSLDIGRVFVLFFLSTKDFVRALWI